MSLLLLVLHKLKKRRMSDDPDEYAEQRQYMVESQLIPRGINDPGTLESMSKVRRHLFVPQHQLPYAYHDGPLSIGYGQTISQPYIVALMTEAAEVEPSSIVLEIGTGSGYAAAVLSFIAQEVYTIERIPELAAKAERLFQTLGYGNIHVKVDDGTLGWPEKGPFSAIIVTAGSPVMPKSLIDQLQPAGRLVIPIGDMYSQELVRVRKSSTGKHSQEYLGGVRFVPLIGKEGWEE